MMTLTILGSGTMMPTKNRHPAGYILETAHTKIVMDCGHTTIARLIDRDIDLQAIDAIAVTHFHTDHIADLLPMVHARAVDDMFSGNKPRPLSIIGPVTIAERFMQLRDVMWPRSNEDYPVTFHEWSGGETLKIGDITLSSFPVHHVEWFESIGYRAASHGRTVAYTGDLGGPQPDGFEEGIGNADVLLVEAGASKPSANHYTPEEGMALAQRLGIERVIFTHVREQRVEEVRTFADLHPSCHVAMDGEQIVI